MAWFKKQRKPIEPPDKQSRVPEGLWVKCPSCGQIIYNKDLAASSSVCTKCAHHFRISATERLRGLFDGEYMEFDRGLTSTDPLKFTDTKPYHQRLDASITTTGLNDAVITAIGKINGIETSVAAMEYSFIGGSMGVVVGAGGLGTPAGHHHLVLRWRADDGRGAVADADGQDQRCAGASGSRWPSLYLDPHRSDDGRRHGELCDAR
jgi:hypothetical protein